MSFTYWQAFMHQKCYCIIKRFLIYQLDFFASENLVICGDGCTHLCNAPRLKLKDTYQILHKGLEVTCSDLVTCYLHHMIWLNADQVVLSYTIIWNHLFGILLNMRFMCQWCSYHLYLFAFILKLLDPSKLDAIHQTINYFLRSKRTYLFFA